MPESVFEFIGQMTIFGGGVAGISFYIFKFLGKNWIETKFNERLENFKHRQDKEIQRLKVEIDSMLSGVLKIQEKEYETLTEAWSKLDDAYRWMGGEVKIIKQYPNLDRMLEAEMEEVLERSVLTNTQKDKVRISNEKGKTFDDEDYRHRVYNVKTKIIDLRTYVIRYGIFMPEDFKLKFDEIIEFIDQTFINYEVGVEIEDYKVRGESWKTWNEEITPLIKQMEIAIRNQLRSHGTKQLVPEGTVNGSLPLLKVKNST